MPKIPSNIVIPKARRQFVAGRTPATEALMKSAMRRHRLKKASAVIRLGLLLVAGMNRFEIERAIGPDWRTLVDNRTYQAIMKREGVESDVNGVD